MSPLLEGVARPGSGRRIRAAMILALGAVATTTAGCGNLQHVEVGSVPDDYRTRHPIVVSEAEETVEIPVVSSETRLSQSSRSRVRGFADKFRNSGAELVRVMVPYGSTNGAAADVVSGDVIATLKTRNIPQARVLVQPYQAAGITGPAPIRLAYVTLKAKTAPCGRWPEDLTETSENKNYFNFGCATQQNLAAQIADPRDLLAPRGVGEIDAERRTNMLEKYRNGEITASEPSETEVDLDF